jgi:diguanylate cyclase (GGDEF)-like protein
MGYLFKSVRRRPIALSSPVLAAGAFVIRHKYRFFDLTVVMMGALLVLYIGMTVDIFANAPNHTPAADTLEFDELLGALVALFLGMLWAIRRLFRERREAAQKSAVEREIRILAFHDPLTDLPNRRQFDDALKAAALAPPRAGASHGILMLDLNGFKRINDVFGHAAGDEVLIHVGKQISKAVREGDLVARLGGDEFAVLATHLPSEETATSLALRIMGNLEGALSTSSGNHTVGAAIGIALTPQDGSSPSELMRKADIALYRAKEQGTSAMRFFEPEMDARVRERDQLERELRKAIEAGDVRSVYQPLMDLKTGNIRAFEALARWTHPELGEIAAERFISIAEDSGLIGLLTDRLLSLACEDALHWPSHIDLAFNVSPLLLRDLAFPTRILTTLKIAGLSANRLELEITESALVRDLESAQAVLGKLRDVGIRIALDDFGTGYSSLYHLRNFKLDTIKIDRSFVETMATNPDSDAIVRALIGLGAGLGLEVIAEGVENEEQRRMLIEHGCDQAQGFYYGSAVSGTDAMSLIGRSRV